MLIVDLYKECFKKNTALHMSLFSKTNFRDCQVTSVNLQMHLIKQIE